MGSANVEQMTNVRQLRENPFVEKRVHLLQPLQRPMAILLLVMCVNIFFEYIFLRGLIARLYKKYRLHIVGKCQPGKFFPLAFVS